MESRLETVVQKVLVDFPALAADKVGDELRIRVREAGEEDVDALVGTYSFDGFSQGEISEQDIREDCEAFFQTSST